MISLVTNVDTATTLRNLERTQRSTSTNIQRLSSGFRINKAADDAAGLAISEGLRGQIRGMAQAQRNAQDAISIIQVAEGALGEIHGALLRMRELAVQSANDTQTTTTRTHIDNEYSALMDEITQIVDSTQFNGHKLLDDFEEYDFQIGANALTAENAIILTAVDFHLLGSTGIGSTLDFTDVLTRSDALDAITIVDLAIDQVSEGRGMAGAVQNRLTLAIDNLASTRENLLAANSRIRDADVATETSEMARNQILAQAGVSVLAQANQLPSLGLSLLR